MLELVSVQPDYFCREDERANIGGPFCARCGRGIMGQAAVPNQISWCYGCGFETGTLPLIDVPLFWGDYADTITFHEARRIADPHFDALAEQESRTGAKR